MNAKEIIKKMMENGKKEILVSAENLRKALAEQGCAPEEIESALAEFPELPLEDDALDAVAGGIDPRIPEGGNTERKREEEKRKGLSF